MESESGRCQSREEVLSQSNPDVFDPAISTQSVYWKWVIQLLIYQFYGKPWERHFGIVSGWEMEDLYAYTMCKHTFN